MLAFFDAAAVILVIRRCTTLRLCSAWRYGVQMTYPYRALVWRNLMADALNTAINDGLVSFPRGNRQSRREGCLEFSLLGGTTVAMVRETDNDEVRVNVIWQPTDEGRRDIRCGGIYDCNNRGQLGLAVAEGCILRSDTLWLQRDERSVLLSPLHGNARTVLGATMIPFIGAEDGQ
jgi:hypothetical protein